VVSINLPTRPPPPRVSAARRAAAAAAAAFLRTLRAAAGRGARDEDDEAAAAALLPSLQNEQNENCGIHAIAVSPSRRHVITGGANPCDVALLDGATLERRALCMVRTQKHTHLHAAHRLRCECA
jgi:hypothetical protein